MILANQNFSIVDLGSVFLKIINIEGSQSALLDKFFRLAFFFLFYHSKIMMCSFR